MDSLRAKILEPNITLEWHDLKTQNLTRWFLPATRLCCGHHQNRRQLFWSFCPSVITTLLSVASFCRKQGVPLIEIPLPQLAASCGRWPSGAGPRCPDRLLLQPEPNLTYAMELDRRNSEYVQFSDSMRLHVSEDVISPTWAMPCNWTDATWSTLSRFNEALLIRCN